MEKAAKEQVLGEIKDAWKNVSSVIIADYRGVRVPVVTAMRDDFRKAGCHYRAGYWSGGQSLGLVVPGLNRAFTAQTLWLWRRRRSDRGYRQRSWLS